MEAAGVGGTAKINGFSVMSPEDFLKKEVGEPEVKEESASLDEYSPMLGVDRTPVDPKDMQDYLHRTKTYTKTKQDKFKNPYIHPSSITYTDEGGKVYDTEKLKAIIKQRPKEILRQNEKLEHSGGDYESMFNVGLPALVGLVVDEETNEFVIVNTCPGAGKCKLICYAMKGNYIRVPQVWIALTRMLNFAINDPEGFIAQLSRELTAALERAKKFDEGLKAAKKFVKPTRVVLRWHDAGDFFSPEYLEIAYNIARKFPMMRFYAYTKLASVALGPKPDNFITNFSMGALPGEERLIDLKTQKFSDVVPKELFYDLIARKGRTLDRDSKGRMQFKGPEAVQSFRTRLSKEFGIPSNILLSYDQIMAKPEGLKQKWIVYVVPGDGDDSAKRRDVLGTYLLFH